MAAWYYYVFNTVQTGWSGFALLRLVPPDDETAQRESPRARDSGRCGSTFIEGADPELGAISRRSLDSAPKEFAIQDRFAGREWHRPYAEALIEQDLARRARLIIEARRAILQRYFERGLEVSSVPDPAEETRDLRNAVIALSKL